MLHCTTTHEATLSKATKERIWSAFLARGTTHSAAAMTLAYLVNRCEQERLGYTLTALPGEGYRMEPLLSNEFSAARETKET